jgi:hypothetical protein
MRKRNPFSALFAFSILLCLVMVRSSVVANEGEPDDAVRPAADDCATLPPKLYVGDFDGDGRSDLGILYLEDHSFHVSRSNGKRFAAPGSKEWLAPNEFGHPSGQYLVGDFDGDLKADLGFFDPSDNSLHVTTSTGSGFWGEHSGRWIAPDEFGHSNGRFYVAFFNGGRKADLGFFDMNDASFWVSLSTGTSFGAKHSGQWIAPGAFGHAGGQYHIGDYNEDGSQDLGYFEPSNNTFHINFSNGEQFWGPGTGQWIEPGDFGHSNGRYRAGDYNGDAIADLGFFSFGDNSFHVSLSTGSHFWGSGSGRWMAPNTFGHQDGQHFVGNFDGDEEGKTDLAFYEPSDNSVHVRLSNGSGFKERTQWARLDRCLSYVPVVFDRHK